MSWLIVARKDFEDSIRSRWLIGLTALFVLLISAVAAFVRVEGSGQQSANIVLQTAGNFFIQALVPLIALVVAYNSIAGERKSGSLKLLLSLPHSRADVVVGKVLGRSAALSTAIVVGFVLPAIIFAIGPFRLEIGAYLGYTLLVVLLAVVYVSIAVGWSAAAPSQRIALGGAIGMYFLFVPFWNAIQLPFLALIALLPEWVPVSPTAISNAVTLANPSSAYTILTNGLFGSGAADLQLSALSMLLFWLLAAPLFGLLIFERRDL